MFLIFCDCVFPPARERFILWRGMNWFTVNKSPRLVQEDWPYYTAGGKSFKLSRIFGNSFSEFNLHTVNLHYVGKESFEKCVPYLAAETTLVSSAGKK